MTELQLLKTLDLEGNNISFVRPNTDLEFPLNITTEMELLLSNNKIQQLGRGAFNSFSKFGKLDLSYNQVRNFTTIVIKILCISTFSGTFWNITCLYESSINDKNKIKNALT